MSDCNCYSGSQCLYGYHFLQNSSQLRKETLPPKALNAEFDGAFFLVVRRQNDCKRESLPVDRSLHKSEFLWVQWGCRLNLWCFLKHGHQVWCGELRVSPNHFCCKQKRFLDFSLEGHTKVWNLKCGNYNKKKAPCSLFCIRALTNTHTSSNILPPAFCLSFIGFVCASPKGLHSLNSF